MARDNLGFVLFFETVFENSSSYPLFSRRRLKMARDNRGVFFLFFFFLETVFEKSSIRFFGNCVWKQLNPHPLALNPLRQQITTVPTAFRATHVKTPRTEKWMTELFQQQRIMESPDCQTFSARFLTYEWNYFGRACALFNFHYRCTRNGNYLLTR